MLLQRQVKHDWWSFFPEKYEFTKEWHEQRQQKDWDCKIPAVPESTDILKKDSILSVLNTLFARIMHDKLLEYHDLKEEKYVSDQVGSVST